MSFPGPASIHIANIYYLPQAVRGGAKESKGLDQLSPVESLDLSIFFESSIDEIPSCAPLFLILISLLDKSNVLKCFFQTKNVLFCGPSVNVFPDVSRATQLH